MVRWRLHLIVLLAGTTLAALGDRPSARRGAGHELDRRPAGDGRGVGRRRRHRDVDARCRGRVRARVALRARARGTWCAAARAAVRAAPARGRDRRIVGGRGRSACGRGAGAAAAGRRRGPARCACAGIACRAAARVPHARTGEHIDDVDDRTGAHSRTARRPSRYPRPRCPHRAPPPRRLTHTSSGAARISGSSHAPRSSLTESPNPMTRPSHAIGAQ